MAKVKKETVAPRYPSEYGSHAGMVDEEATKALNDPALVVCVDDHGPYQTKRTFVDSGLADPNRWDFARAEKAQKAKEKKK